MELGGGEQLFFGGGGTTLFFSVLGIPNDTCLNTSDFIKKNHNGHLLKCRTVGLFFYIFSLLCVLALQVSPLCFPSKCFLKYSSSFVF